MSLNTYFYRRKNDPLNRQLGKEIIPNFVGVSGHPTYPVTESYAKHTIVVHTPWRKYPNYTDWIAQFHKLIRSKDCPTSVRMGYERVMLRHMNRTKHLEPKASNVDHSKNHLDNEDKQLMELLGMHTTDEPDYDKIISAVNRLKH